jgi:biotin carboxyl carrier protein
VRRDGGVRAIDTHEVRYPGARLPQLDDLSDRARREGVIGPVRDTGIAVEGRMVRQQRRRAAARRRNAVFAVIAVVALSTLALGWRYSSDRAAARHPLKDATLASGHRSPSAMIGSSNRTITQPLFASYKSLQLRLPVPVDQLTEVGFHQAAYNYALHMATPLPDADSQVVKASKTTSRTPDQRPTGVAAVLGGKVLRLWRSRPGKPDSAVDVGAPAGTSVFSPVNGTITKIKPYKLYGRLDDVELHIQPDGWSDIDLVMIHITDVSVAVGDKVKAGVTPVAKIRNLHKLVHHQLGDYTVGGGDHVHFQLNNAKDPQYKGLEGAVLPEGS